MAGDSIAALVPFSGYVGVEVKEFAAGSAVAVLASRPELLNHIGSLHAGALYTLAETASGAAMLSGLGPLIADASPLVRSSTTAFRKIAGGPIKATAKMDAPVAETIERFRAEGRVDFKVSVSLTNDQAVEVAFMSFQWSLRARRTA